MNRLVLFDIDGTLVRGGPAKEAFEVAMAEVYGTAGDVDGVSFAGKTDPQIARELLRGVGLSDEVVDRGLPSLWEAYLGELETRLPTSPLQVIEGVAELLGELEASGSAVLGLVTGNIVGGARLKLDSAGLFDRFVAGGYGSDHELRNHLPGIAIQRAREICQIDFSGRDVVVVGDTPRDVECGQHAGARTVAVATGYFAVAELRAAGADRVLPDFSSTREAIRAILLDDSRVQG